MLGGYRSNSGKKKKKEKTRSDEELFAKFGIK